MFSLEIFTTGFLGRAFAVIGSAGAVHARSNASARARQDYLAERGLLAGDNRR